MEFCINDMLYALSFALDSVETELLGARAHHSERVALLCVETGRQLGLSDDELLDLAACAVLHDNALTEYVALLHSSGGSAQAVQAPQASLRPHCEIGERNVAGCPLPRAAKTPFSITMKTRTAAALSDSKARRRRSTGGSSTSATPSTTSTISTRSRPRAVRRSATGCVRTATRSSTRRSWRR